jgi:hypothetical protein
MKKNKQYILKKLKKLSFSSEFRNADEDKCFTVYSPENDEVFCSCDEWIKNKTCVHTKPIESSLKKLKKQNDNAN